MGWVGVGAVMGDMLFSVDANLLKTDKSSLALIYTVESSL